MFWLGKSNLNLHIKSVLHTILGLRDKRNSVRFVFLFSDVCQVMFFGVLCPELWFVCVVPTNGYMLLHLHLNKTPILKVVLSFYSLKTKPGIHISLSYHVLCLTPQNPLDPFKDLPCSEHFHHYPRVTLSTLVNFLMTLPNVNSLRKPVEGRGDVLAPSKRCQLNLRGW